jgi:hypothetical protein
MIVVVHVTSEKPNSMKDFNLFCSEDSCILGETELQQWLLIDIVLLMFFHVLFSSTELVWILWEVFFRVSCQLRGQG